MTFPGGSSPLSSSVQAFLERYGGSPDAEGRDAVLGQHDHLARDIGGAFTTISLDGPMWSTNWNGTIPPDLSAGADPAATLGFAFDPQAGAIQAMAVYGTIDITVGIGALWFTDTPPTGWLLLDGTDRSRAAYPDLFALWGTTFGVGDGSTTFGTPDMRGFFPFGKATSGTGSGAIGTTFGAIDHVHTGPAHTHTTSAHTHDINHNHSFSDSFTTSTASVSILFASGSTASAALSHSHSGSVSGTTSTNGGQSGSGGGAATGSSGTGNTGTGNPPGIVVNFIVKY